MSIPKSARRLKNRIFATKVEPYVPNFAEQDIVPALARYVKMQSRPTARFDWIGSGQLPACREDVVAHFRTRQVPSFFSDTGTFAALASAMKTRHAAWHDRLLEIVAFDRAEGLQIYSLKGPPLRPGFPWSGLDMEPNDDDLYSIRPHRFGFAPRHALAVLYGGQPAAALADILEDWMTFATRGKSELPYGSSLVVIQRLVALSWAHAFVIAMPESDEPDVLRLHLDILRIIRADIDFLLPRLGKSAPNNHLLADRFAAWYIRLLFPEFIPGTLDLDACEAAWLAELERQIYPDGTGFEHSLHYHEIECEMAAAYVLLSRRNARPIPTAALERIERMLGFQVALAGPNCIAIPFGDTTEDPLFGLDAGNGWGTAGLRELYRALFRPELAPAPPTTPSVERAFWLLGGTLAPRVPCHRSREAAPKVWPDGGWCVLPDEAMSACIQFRTGPAVHQRLAAGHMHADLLSVCASHGDQPVLVDPGTWCYRWWPGETGPGRTYFAGPAAHNGLSLDALDPLGPVQGDFRNKEIPVRVSTTRCLLGRRFTWVEAEVRGKSPYAGWRRGVVHIPGAYWIVYDRLPPGIDPCSATLGFQTAAGVQVRRDENETAWLETAAGTLWLARGPQLDGPQVIQGASTPPGGWVAPTYGVLKPAAQLRYGTANGASVTAFALGVGTAAARPVAVRALDVGLAVEIEGTGSRDLLLLAAHGEGIAVNMPDRQGDAQALWMRSTDERRESLRCLGLRSRPGPEDAVSDRDQNAGTETRLPCANEQHDIEFREPKNLSITFSGEAWH